MPEPDRKSDLDRIEKEQQKDKERAEKDRPKKFSIIVMAMTLALLLFVSGCKDDGLRVPAPGPVPPPPSPPTGPMRTVKPGSFCSRPGLQAFTGDGAVVTCRRDARGDYRWS